MSVMEGNILTVKNRSQFREWLMQHAEYESECWVCVEWGRPKDPDVLYYLDAVEEALCFGWTDSRHKLIDEKRVQRFSPRIAGDEWTELDKERVRRLEKLGMMTEAGRSVLPAMGKRSFTVDREFVLAMKKARCWAKFKRFPPLYQRVRAYNIAFCRKHSPEIYDKALKHLIKQTKIGKMFGDWNDYGRLLDY